MPLSKLFYGLFSGSLLILFVLLGYGGILTYKSETKKIQEEIDRVVQNVADTVQNKNYGLYDFIKVYTDKDYEQKIAFAAGMTQNQKRFSVSFDDSNQAPPSHVPKSALEKHDSVVWGTEPKKEKPTWTISKKTQDTIRRNLPAGMAVTFGDTSTVSKPAKNKHDSVIVKITPTGELPIRIAMNKKARDTGKKYTPAGVKTITYFDSLLTVQLKKEGLVALYNIEKITRPCPNIKWASGMFIINFYDPDVYRIVYLRPTSLLIKRLLPYTGISLFLLVLVSSAFLLYHKSYRMQLQTAQFRESLLSNVTHELKTPVASLQLIINALSNDNEGAVKQQEYIDFAGKELTRMKTLIEKILSFSKLNERQFDLNKEIVNVAGLIKEAIEIMQPSVANVCGTIKFEQHGDPELLGDRILLLNVVINIIDNALKYSMNKPVIHISLCLENGNVKITIMDNGMGIPSQFHKKIFEPFFRIPTGNKYDIPGHGIGLSFVRQTVKLHNGSISVSSEKEKGSTFIISLPAL